MYDPRYNPEKNEYCYDDTTTGSPGKGEYIADQFAVYSLRRANAGRVEAILIEDGYSFQGAQRLAQNYASCEANSVVYVVVDRVTGMLQGLDRVQFMQDFPPPSAGHIPVIIKFGNEQFELIYKDPEYSGRKPIDPEDEFINPNLEQPVSL